METDHVVGSQSVTKPSNVPSCSSNTTQDDAYNFECNICFELAQDPIITLCGHLYCWPCLYIWLHMYSHSHECPVCKALIEEDKLVPLYGRGTTTHSDPRSRSPPPAGVEIPRRPTGQRPETVPTFHENHQFPQQEVRISPAVFQVLMSFQMHSDATGYGTSIDSFHGGHAHGSNQHSSDQGQESFDNIMSSFRYTLLLFGFAVLGFLCFG